MGNNQDNCQLHRFTGRDNTAKSFRGATFLTHTVHVVVVVVVVVVNNNIISISIITAICITQNRLRATNALSGISSTVTT